MKRLVGAVVLLLMLSGCASLPVTGPVRIGPDLASGNSIDSFYYSPSPPVKGASAQDILNGFLAAGTGPQNDYAIAREFLSESIRSTWNPSQEVLIQRISPQITFADEDEASIEIELAARIDADGRYEAMPSGTTKMLTFGFVKENGEWRLSSVPDATVIIRPVFEVIFRSYSVYFLDRQQRFLVPDLRWFPTTPATSTRIVNALLRGPSLWLKPSVTSAIPSGTRLSIDAVTVEGGTALVDLTARALVATRADRSLMKAQLNATLTQLPNVQQVAISIERSRQEIPDSLADLLVEPTAPLVAIDSEGLSVAAGNDIEFRNLPKTLLKEFPTKAFDVSRSANVLAGLTSQGIYRIRFDQIASPAEFVDRRADLIAPVIDRQQFTWSVTRALGSNLLATSAAGDQFEVVAPWLAQESVLSLDISAEGTRAVLLVAGAERNRVLLSSVIRDKRGVPIGLADPIELGADLIAPISANWAGDLSVAVVNASGELRSVNIFTVGGLARTISAPPNALTVLAAGGNQALYALGADGELYNFRSLSWQLISTQVQAIALAH